MKITSIKQQVKHRSRYSIFVDGKYCFSLSDTALLESKLVVGQELDEKRVRELKQASADDKLYGATLRYVYLRPRSRWEIEQYLLRKKASPALADTILNKLSNIDMIDDDKFAAALLRDRQLLRPTSRRKMVLELRKKHIANETITEVMETFEAEDEHAALNDMIAKKRRLARYHDDLKLMQYLAGQGFNYSDIKTALSGQDNLN